MRHGILAQFDFGAIADATAHPYRLQCEQSRLTRILYEQLRGAAGLRASNSTAPSSRSARTPAASPSTIKRNGKTETHAGRYLIGADGARSDVRRSLGIDFEGFTWPDRFLVVSTPFDFYGVDRRPRAGELCRRSAALAVPAADPRPVAGDVPGLGGRERRDRADAGVRAVADGDRRARNLELRDRPYHALPGAPAGREDHAARPVVPGRRCRAHQQSARRHGHERRHP